jgi:plasmid stabilization system protein ParE
VAARTRDVVWAESAQRALDDILGDIALESPAGAAKVLIRALDVAVTLSTLSERGRVVPELGEATLREVFVYEFRLIYRIRPDGVVIRAFLHGARDFSKWRREDATKL